MAYFNQGGKSKFGGNKGGSRGKQGSWDKEPVMHKAVCATCGKTCEVPFKPMNGKPVYCRDCFQKEGGNREGGSSDRFPKREFNNDRGSRPQFSNAGPSHSAGGAGNDEVKKQLESVNSKLERLIHAVESLARTNEIAHSSKIVEIVTAEPAAKMAKADNAKIAKSDKKAPAKPASKKKSK